MLGDVIDGLGLSRGLVGGMPAAQLFGAVLGGLVGVHRVAGAHLGEGDGPRVFRTAAWWLLCCLLPVQVLVVDLEWGLVAES